jgi:phosphoadenosine phosphosulfate reductase
MQRAIEQLGVGTWFSGLRRHQSIERAKTPFVERSGDRFKVHPIADWTDKDIYNYLKTYDLPYHPLWEKGYVSIGDVHTTKSLADVESIEETRFFGLKRECGLHELDFGNTGVDAKSA